MATTTPNFGWDIPQSTDLVKDGATAIAALGTDIDTALVDLKGGTTGQYLTKNSNTDLDFVWAAVSAGGYTSLASGNLTGSAVNLTSISQSYKKLVLVMRNMSISGSDEFVIRLNNSSSSIYGWYTVISNSAPSVTGAIANTSIIKMPAGNQDAANTKAHYVLEFEDYTASATQIVHAYGAMKSSSYAQISAFLAYGVADTQSAITEINLKADYGGAYTFDNGTYELFGVK